MKKQTEKVKSHDPNKMTSFGESALALDQDFLDLDKLSAQIGRLDIHSDEGFERAKPLLQKFCESGQKVASGVQCLAASLEEARKRAESAAQLVSQKAAQFQERQQSNEQMLERFRALGERVKAISSEIGELKSANPDDSRARLSEFDSRLTSLVSQAKQLKDDAHRERMKNIERNADSLGQSLDSARRKLAACSKSFLEHTQIH